MPGKLQIAFILLAVGLLAGTFKASPADEFFDSYGKIVWADEKARLYHFARFLRHDPDMIGYIAFNWSNKAEFAEMTRRTERAVRFLVHVLKINRKRIVVIQGGKWEEPRTVLQPSKKGIPPLDFTSMNPEELTQYFAEYGKIPWLTERVHLDNFLLFLLRYPDMIGYIGFHWSSRAEYFEMKRRVQRARRYLIRNKKLRPNRIIIIEGRKQAFPLTILQPIKKGAPPLGFGRSSDQARVELGRLPVLTCVSITHRGEFGSTTPSAQSGCHPS